MSIRHASFVTFVAATLFCALLAGVTSTIAQFAAAPADPAWSVPEIGALPDNDQTRLIRRGRDLITILKQVLSSLKSFLNRRPRIRHWY